MQEHVTALEVYRPTLLAGPPSALRLLARAAEQGRLSVRPEKIVSVAEVLDPLDRQALTRAFGREVHELYQATEGFLAATCGHGVLHLNEDLIVVEKEVLDERARKFAPIITDFTRRAQPILRYRLNDVLTERAEPCACGSVMTAIERIEGRCDDTLYVPRADGRGLRRVFPDFVCRAILGASSRIDEYAVRQVSATRLEVSLEVDDPAARAGVGLAVRHALASLFRGLGAVAPEVAFVPYVAPPLTQKLRRVQRAFPVSPIEAEEAA
jgi:putative adenylate-forming enzyme